MGVKDITTSNAATSAELNYILDFNGNPTPTKATLKEENNRLADQDISVGSINDGVGSTIVLSGLLPSLTADQNSDGVGTEAGGYPGAVAGDPFISSYNFLLEIDYDNDATSKTIDVDFASFDMDTVNGPTLDTPVAVPAETNGKTTMEVSFDFSYGESKRITSSTITY
jgi:hypothetical protein